MPQLGRQGLMIMSLAGELPITEVEGHALIQPESKPPIVPSGDVPTPRWRDKLHFKIAFSQLSLLVLMITATITVLMTVERDLLVEQGYEIAEQLGNRVVSDLQDRVSLAEGVTTTLSNLGEALPHDESEFMRVIPHVFDFEGEESFIAGGGIWPEPGAFEEGKARRSFFWGRDAEGKLQYFDDYNDPAGNGYHNEEWYVPAKSYPPGKAFWSKSYMDPYSYQPMVTCTVPMKQGGKLTGVATLDLKLEGLQEFLGRRAEAVGGYIFAVDRNNKFLTFPQNERAKVYGTDDKGTRTEEFKNATELGVELPAFRPVAEALQRVNERLIKLAEGLDGGIGGLAEKFDRESYQIDAEEGRLCAAVLRDPMASESEVSKLITRFVLDDDVMFGEPVLVSVFHMPRTYWKVVVVTPIAHFYAQADAITFDVGRYIVGLELLSLCVMFLIMRRFVVRPLRRMSNDLARVSKADGSLDASLDESERSELGLLAYEFNRRTGRLAHALADVECARDEMEQRVEDRTAELREAVSAVHLLHDVSSEANKTDDLEATCGFTLARICEFADWQVGEVYLRDRESGALCVSQKRFGAGDRRYENLLRDGRPLLTPDVGLITDAVVKCELVRAGLLPDVLDGQARMGELQASGLRSVYAFPVVVGSVVVAVFAGYAVAVEPFDEGLLDLTRSLSAQIAWVVERHYAVDDREAMHVRLRESSRQAGMADVATSVLHNVGNVLNSVNVSAGVAIEMIEGSKLSGLRRAVALLKEHADDLAEFLSTDDHGSKFMRYLGAVSERLAGEHSGLRVELVSLGQNIEHIKQIIAMQQDHASDTSADVVEQIDVCDMFEDAIRISQAACDDRDVRVERDFASALGIVTTKHKLMQILVNLIKNAAEALENTSDKPRVITLRVRSGKDEGVVLEVGDNGMGIAADDLNLVFSHGFTTKENGHGFGLHSSAIAATELGGSLRVRSDGPGCGAVFTILLPALRPARFAGSGARL